MSVKSSLPHILFLSFLFPLLGGCSSGPGKGLSLFGSANRLMDEAKEMRQANAHALQIPRELEKEPLPSYTVEPGDVLLVQPIDLDSPARLPGDQPILTDGTINLGKYGRLQVAGKTLLEIEGTINGLVRAQTEKAGFISVRIVSRISKVYYVLGAVNSPGAFQLAGRETALDAILAAGGLTDSASRDNIILVRPSKPNCCRTVLPVCYRHIVQLGDTTTNYQIAPGDRIYVAAKTICETLLGPKHSKSPCLCGGSHTPCTLPPYLPGPCPEEGHTPISPAAPLTLPATTGPALPSKSETTPPAPTNGSTLAPAFLQPVTAPNPPAPTRSEPTLPAATTSTLRAPAPLPEPLP
jgi:protein involved in polysaccharide export with SLBB domain